MSLASRLGLNEDERVIMTIRSAPVTVLVPGSVSMSLLLAPLFFLTPLLRLATLGTVMLAVSLGLGTFFGLRTMVRWFGTKTVITDRRVFIIRKDGLLSRKVHTLPFSKMQGVSYRVKGFFQTVFRYGTILIRPTAGKPLRIDHVLRPAMVEGFLAEAIEEGEAGTFGDLLHAVSDMEARELKLLKSEIERSLKHRGEQ